MSEFFTYELRDLDFFQNTLYERTLQDHLVESFKLAKCYNCSHIECMVALYHSFYGDLYGYNAYGCSYNDREKIKKY